MTGGRRLDLRAVLAVRVEETTTGFPAGADLAVADVGSRGWNLFEDLVPPVVVLRERALEHNLELMSAYCRANGVELAPHGKTSMAPQLWARQLDAGAWGVTAATPVQARAMRSAGVPSSCSRTSWSTRGRVGWVARGAARRSASPAGSTRREEWNCCARDSWPAGAAAAALADRTRRAEEARPLIEAALAQTPDSAAVQDSMGWVLHKLGENAAALEYLRKARENASDPEIDFHIGEVQWALGQRDEARQTWGEALERNPEDTRLKRRLERAGQ